MHCAQFLLLSVNRKQNYVFDMHTHTQTQTYDTQYTNGKSNKRKTKSSTQLQGKKSGKNGNRRRYTVCCGLRESEDEKKNTVEKHYILFSLHHELLSELKANKVRNSLRHRKMLISQHCTAAFKIQWHTKWNQRLDVFTFVVSYRRKDEIISCSLYFDGKMCAL